VCGEDRGHKDERIKIQKEANGVAELIIPLGLSLDKEKEEKK
jgi:hypothetical protein